MKKMFLFVMLGVLTLMSSCSKKDDAGNPEFYFNADIVLPDGSKASFSQTEYPYFYFSIAEVRDLKTLVIVATDKNARGEQFNLSVIKFKGKGKYVTESVTEGFTGQYGIGKGSDLKSYSNRINGGLTSGEIDITEYSDEVIVGTFSFVGNDHKDASKQVRATGKFRCKVVKVPKF